MPTFNRIDFGEKFINGVMAGREQADISRRNKALDALQRIYSGDQSAMADLMAADPEAGRTVETQIGAAKFVKPAGPEVELAGPVRPGVDEPLTTRTPASVDTEGLTVYLASRGDSGALKALLEKAGPQASKWLGSTVTDKEGKVWGVNEQGWQQLPFEAKPEAPKAEKPPKPQMVRGDDGQVYWLEPGEQLPPGVTAKGSAPSLNEGERNAAGFYERATETGQKINALEDAGGALPTAGTDLAGLLGDYAESKAMSDEQQTYRTLAMSWIRAKLRKESGAAISDKEAESEYKTYFPVPGDSPMRIEEKRRLRAIAENELKMSAGRAITDKPQGGQQSGIPPIPHANASAAYQEYWAAYHSAKTPEQRKAITARARQMGVVK